ncbi:MAG: hypothetical protein IH605_10800 [Burkholderiales bacterium]|nr:hypothetical protein [Burkholderiales bacterium]
MAKHKFQLGEVAAVIGAVFFQIGSLAAVLAFTLVPFAHATNEPAAGATVQVAGEKLDTGLGQLPDYSQWSQHVQLAGLVVAASNVPGESLDSGLGELPNYNQWAGHPQLVSMVDHIPGEKLDSGLGELPPYSQWVDNSGRLRLEVASRK